MKILFKIIKTLLRICLVFLLAFVWVKYFDTNNIFAFFISAGICATEEVARFVYLKKHAKKASNNIPQKAENAFFSLYKYKTYVKFFEDICKLKTLNLVTRKNIITLQDEQKTTFFLFFKYKNLDADTIADFLAVTKSKKIIFVCHDYDKNLQCLCQKYNKEIFILNYIDTYNQIYSAYNFYPQSTETAPKEQNKFKKFCSLALAKKQSKYYFISSGVLCIYAIFLPYSIYYAVFATLLFALGVVCHMHTHHNMLCDKQIL